MKQTLIFLVFLFLNTFFLSFIVAQNSSETPMCGTTYSEEEVAELRRSFDYQYSENRDMIVNAQHLKIPVKFHIIRDDRGRGGISLGEIDTQLKNLNKIYTVADISFYRYDEPNYIDDSYFADDFSRSKEESLLSKNDVSKVMNVFCFPKMVGYYGYYSGASGHIYMSKEGMINSSTFPHEVGHFFGLFHTHGKANRGPTDELVDRNIDNDSNGKRDCEETGDDCCDTPADPDLLTHIKLYTQDCSPSYYDEVKDPEGNVYRPLVDNLMSYNQHKYCRKNFTKDQIDRIRMYALKKRTKMQAPKEQLTTNRKQISGEIEFHLDNGTPMPVSRKIKIHQFKKAYYTGDEFSFSAKNTSRNPLYLYIINEGPTGDVIQVYPYYDYEQPLLKSGERYELGGSIELDNKKGKELACFLFSRKKIDFDKLIGYLKEESGNLTIRLQKVFGKNLLPLDYVQYKEGDNISFSGYFTEHQILPIIIEMNHQ